MHRETQNWKANNSLAAPQAKGRTSKIHPEKAQPMGGGAPPWRGGCDFSHAPWKKKWAASSVTQGPRVGYANCSLQSDGSSPVAPVAKGSRPGALQPHTDRPAGEAISSQRSTACHHSYVQVNYGTLCICCNCRCAAETHGSRFLFLNGNTAGCPSAVSMSRDLPRSSAHPSTGVSISVARSSGRLLLAFLALARYEQPRNLRMPCC